MDFDPSKDYYNILEINEDASIDEIKKSFRKLAMKYHPDKKGGNKDKFQAINEAHGVLGDEQKKQQYDMYRKHGGSMGGIGGMGGFSGFGGNGGFEVDLGDVMDQFFGTGRARSSAGPRSGEDIQVRLDISFEESYTGITKTISYTRKQMVDGVTEENCPTCKGTGRVTQQAQTIFGVMQTQNVCPTCHGIGKVYSKDHKTIPGGLESKKESIDVVVPEGIKDGVYIKHTGKGDAGAGGGPTGDLYVKIHVKASKVYSRQGNDLYLSQEVSLFDLVLGGELTIPHPTGEKTIKIPKGTQISDKIKINKLGFASKGVFSSYGDLYITPKVAIPKRLTKEESELRGQLAKLSQ